MKVCKFCGQKFEKLADSHIIPKSFFKYTRNKCRELGFGDPIMITNTKGQHPRSRLLIGWYDSNLNCVGCEKKFGPYDDYAAQLLLQKEAMHKPMIENQQVSGWIIDEFNYKKLKLFFISFLWRAGASQLPQFSKIQLDSSIMENAKRCLLSGNLGEDKTFSFIIARSGDDIGKAYYADPHPEIKNDLFGDIGVYRFYLGAGYTVFINIGEKSFPSLSQPLVVTKDKPILVLRKTDFLVGSEAKSFGVVLKESDEVFIRLKTQTKPTH